MGAIGVKGSQAEAARIENVFPKAEELANLMYLYGILLKVVRRQVRHVVEGYALASTTN